MAKSQKVSKKVKRPRWNIGRSKGRASRKIVGRACSQVARLQESTTLCNGRIHYVGSGGIEGIKNTVRDGVPWGEVKPEPEKDSIHSTRKCNAWLKEVGSHCQWDLDAGGGVGRLQPNYTAKGKRAGIGRGGLQKT